jgi:hypothetical protein
MRISQPSRQLVPPRSAFAGFRFPPEVIVVAVRWYLRFGLSYRDVEELPHRAGYRGRPRHHLPLGAAVHAAAGRRRSAVPAQRRGSLAGRRDLPEGRWPLAVRLSCGRSVRSGHRRARLRPPDAAAARRFFEQAATQQRPGPSSLAVQNVLGESVAASCPAWSSSPDHPTHTRTVRST